ncbi:metallophosphoesterase [Croceiramulus getboli]|nr:metallophosphoesterase [Flavobacteriaceae bacterium YJPT1-3]
MGRTLVIGDIHGGLRALEQVLERATVTPDDHLIFLGDYVDGWSDSAPTVSYLIELKSRIPTTFIRGNHDDLVHQWLNGRQMNAKWLQHGGQASIDSYAELTGAEIETHKIFYSEMQDYHIDADNRMYCHAGFSNLNGPEYEWHNTAFYWDRTLWEMVCAMDPGIPKDSDLFPKRLKLFQEIFIGHTPVGRIGRSTPTQMANVWNIDTGAAFKGSVSILDVDSKNYWQSDPVWKLYPQENGRNP